MTGIFATFGIGVSAAIIAVNGGFTAPVKIPTDEDIWIVGSNIQDGTTLEYVVDSRGPASSLNSALLTMTFEEAGENWDVTFDIKNGTGDEISETIVMSKELTREGGIDEAFVPYFEPIQTSILAVRDMEYGESPKYLVVGAPWNTIFVGPSSAVVRVTSEETVQTRAGSFDSFVLSYKLDDDTSRIWMVASMPLPVKAFTFDEADQPYYSFELVRTSGVNTRAETL